jgi:hypothetical protein
MKREPHKISTFVALILKLPHRFFIEKFPSTPSFQEMESSSSLLGYIIPQAVA